MKKFTTAILLVGLFVFAAGISQAAEYKVDPVHSNIVFKIRHILGKVTGIFEKYSGKVVFDPNDLPGSKIEVTIQVGSINTFVPKRDEHLRTPDFFAAKDYPEMSFVSSQIVHKSGNVYEVKGTLSAKDVSKPITVDFQYHGSKANPMDPKQTIGAINGAFTINRLDYHIGSGKFYDLGLVGKEVELWFDFEMIKAQ